MKNISLLLSMFCAVIVLMSASCKEDTNVNLDINSKIEVTNAFPNSTDGRTLNLNSATLTGDNLTLDIFYNCGCGESEFTLYAQSGIMKSDPPQTNVRLVLQGDDFCEAGCMREITFNLSDLKEHFQNNHSGNTLVLQIEGVDGSITYTF